MPPTQSKLLNSRRWDETAKLVNREGNSVSNTGNNDEVLGECATIGAAVLAAQRVEFLLYGLIAHVKPELKQR